MQDTIPRKKFPGRIAAGPTKPIAPKGRATARKSQTPAAGVAFISPPAGATRPKLPAAPNGADLVRNLRATLGVTQGDMARLMRVSLRTLQRLETGTSRLEGGDFARHRELKSLADALTDVIPAKDLKEWIQIPLEELGDRSTYDALAAGDSGKVWRMIYQLQSGTPE